MTEWQGVVEVEYDQYAIGQPGFGDDDSLPNELQVRPRGVIAYAHRHSFDVELSVVEDQAPSATASAVSVEVPAGGWEIADTGVALPQGRWLLWLVRGEYDEDEVRDRHYLHAVPLDTGLHLRLP